MVSSSHWFYHSHMYFYVKINHILKMINKCEKPSQRKTKPKTAQNPQSASNIAALDIETILRTYLVSVTSKLSRTHGLFTQSIPSCLEELNHNKHTVVDLKAAEGLEASGSSGVIVIIRLWRTDRQKGWMHTLYMSYFMYPRWCIKKRRNRRKK